jgi:hypothetical protein
MRGRHMATRNDIRNAEIWSAHCAGISRHDIAQRHGISTTRVSQIVAAERRALPVETRAEMIQREEALLLQLRAEALAVWNTKPNPVINANGSRVKREDGTYAEDHSERFRGLTAALAITKRMADMFGLDAPREARVEMTAPTIPPEVEAKLAAARAAVAAREAAIIGAP